MVRDTGQLAVFNFLPITHTSVARPRRAIRDHFEDCSRRCATHLHALVESLVPGVSLDGVGQ